MARLLSYTEMAVGISAYPAVFLFNFIIANFHMAVKFSTHKARCGAQIEKVRLKRPTAARDSSAENERAV